MDQVLLPSMPGLGQLCQATFSYRNYLECPRRVGRNSHGIVLGYISTRGK